MRLDAGQTQYILNWLTRNPGAAEALNKEDWEDLYWNWFQYDADDTAHILSQFLINHKIIPGAFDNYIQTAMFYGVSGLKQYIVPEFVVEIHDNAFTGSDIESVIVNQYCENIGMDVFKDCEKLQNIKISDQVQRLGRSCFEASGIKSLKLPHKLIFIPEGLCSYCPNLKEVYIPKDVRKIALSAFNESPIETIYFEGSEDDWDKLIYDRDESDKLFRMTKEGKVKFGVNYSI